VTRTLTMVVSAELNNMKKLIITLMVSAAVAHAGNTDSFIEKIGGQGNGTLGAAANKGRGKSTVGSAYGVNANNDAYNGGPTNAQALEAVNYYISRVFKDPHSVQDLRLLNVFFNTRATTHKDWVIVFECNAKNGFGGYTGLHTHAIMWKDGAIDIAATQNFQWWQDFREAAARYQ